ncbi:hypothetical protein V1525DRAFT_409485 [Lipomyces kononenkoae]|uniref:Uncharacterized protein n=1 Tax=Lipomyces kononenkoae TaxID=34357 RepID=A0ACC3SVA4_LIPKO
MTLAMDQSEVVIENSNYYCRQCSSCRSWIYSTTSIEHLEQTFTSPDGRPLETCQKCHAENEQMSEVLRILHWACKASENNPKMQRDICRFIDCEAFMKRFKRPYEEAMRSSRVNKVHTMRKAPRSYDYRRTHDDKGREN